MKELKLSELTVYDIDDAAIRGPITGTADGKLAIRCADGKTRTCPVEAAVVIVPEDVPPQRKGLLRWLFGGRE